MTLPTTKSKLGSYLSEIIFIYTLQDFHLLSSFKFLSAGLFLRTVIELSERNASSFEVALLTSPVPCSLKTCSVYAPMLTPFTLKNLFLNIKINNANFTVSFKSFRADNISPDKNTT